MFKFSKFNTFATSCNFLKEEFNAVLLGYALTGSSRVVVLKSFGHAFDMALKNLSPIISLASSHQNLDLRVLKTLLFI